MSNLLAIPLIKIVVNTGNNEDWIDPILFLVSDTVPDTTPENQLDIRGIKFLMEVRRDQLSHEVVMTASTENGMIAIGEMPDYGYLIIQVPMAEVRPNQPGAYVADIVGDDGVNNRVVVQIDLNIVDGVTR